MMLSELLYNAPLVNDIQISGITADSREVKPGSLFVAMPGETVDGRDYIPDAVNLGAAAVISEAPAPKTDSIPVIEVEDLASSFGEIASRYYGNPSDGVPVIAVTGTNGKTSFTVLLASALAALGTPSGVVGTMGFGRVDALQEPGLTTPAAIGLQRRLATMRADGCEAFVLEASSHGLVQGRLQGTEVDIAVFTNITHDHLDYHDSFEEYYQAKLRLFLLNSIKTVVINRDDPMGKQLIEEIPGHVKVIQFSVRDPSVEVFADEIRYEGDGIACRIILEGEQIEFKSRLLGGFNVQNLLAVIASLHGMQKSSARIVEAVSALQPVTGRMDVVRLPGLPTAIVDYAHTPDALQKCLEAVRQHYPEKTVWCVFGCGGDRDTDKRPKMGAVAERLADRVIVTSDNPRSENPDSIIAAIVNGLSNQATATTITDRRDAICSALVEAGPEDIVVVAGKGHENYQELNTGRVEFSDFQVIDEAMRLRQANGEEA